ncbi:hypothetical protein ACLD02_06765 [Alloalcanivorax sp. C16-2]|uniref:hypothetical protein n=1 Tax=Alloalcanivorax TaxID=3020832 RepID=UPI0019316364|nr:hypothetical protein [Alloalcanivorax marinus]MBL7251349.1 hypothetical protein [Alloalcanivorax marinus]
MRSSIIKVPAMGLIAASTALVPLTAQAGAELSAGVWWVYQNVTKSDFTSPAFSEELDDETGGNFADPSLVIYADDDGSYGPWHFSAETRFGTGSFTNTASNNSGDNIVVHKAWIGYDVTDSSSLKIGKSQVPFGWKTANFWPGDGLEGGYGDQMDVGLKYSADAAGGLHYDVAYFHQDDWGEDSTDTVDDNGHWGTSDTYRKIKTGVVNLDWNFMEGHTVGVSAQYGRMQDLAAADVANRNDEGTHQAYDLHYMFEKGNWSAKYRFIHAERDFSGMDAFLASASAPADEEVETQRHVAELGYTHDNWFYYVDAGVASTDTTGNDADDVTFYAPGVRYQYGPGWIYLEYLGSDGDIAASGDIYESDFNALYVAFDFYF